MSRIARIPAMNSHDRTFQRIAVAASFSNAAGRDYLTGIFADLGTLVSSRDEALELCAPAFAINGADKWGRKPHRSTNDRKGPAEPFLQLASDILGPQEDDEDEEELSDEAAELDAIPNLCPGDFRTVRQLLDYLPGGATNARRLAALREESARKTALPPSDAFDASPRRAIGF